MGRKPRIMGTQSRQRTKNMTNPYFVAGGWWATFPGKGSFTQMDVSGSLVGEVGKGAKIAIDYVNSIDIYEVIAVEGSCVTLGALLRSY